MTHLYYQQAKFILLFQNLSLYFSTDFWYKEAAELNEYVNTSLLLVNNKLVNNY